MVDLEGFGQFLQNLKNQGMHPYLMGDFPVEQESGEHAQTRSQTLFGAIELNELLNSTTLSFLPKCGPGPIFWKPILNAFDGLECHGEAFNPHFIGYPNRTEILGRDAIRHGMRTQNG